MLLIHIVLFIKVNQDQNLDLGPVNLTPHLNQEVVLTVILNLRVNQTITMGIIIDKMFLCLTIRTLSRVVLVKEEGLSDRATLN